MKGEQSENNICEMCEFLIRGFKHAHSKQAKAEYGEGYITHHLNTHISKPEEPTKPKS